MVLVLLSRHRTPCICYIDILSFSHQIYSYYSLPRQRYGMVYLDILGSRILCYFAGCYFAHRARQLKIAGIRCLSAIVRIAV